MSLLYYYASGFHFILKVQLGLIFKNESINQDMIEILEELHEKYLPVKKSDIITATGEEVDIFEELDEKYLPINKSDITVTGEEVATVCEKIFFGGDQLTYERSSNCIDARSDGDSQYERLEGYISKVEDWHAIRILYQVGIICFLSIRL